MSLRRNLLRVYWAMERRLVPGLEYSQHKYEAHLLRWIPQDAIWLDVGCGRRLLPPWRAAGEQALLARTRSLTGIDLDLGSLRDNSTAHHRVYGPVDRLPFRDATFQVVTANMVVEHLADPVGAFTEVARVLQPGGLFLFHTPNASAFPTAVARRIPEALKSPLARLLDGRKAADVFPTYYRCNTPADVRRNAEGAGFSVAELSLVSSTALFSVVPPLAFVELLWLRSVQREARQNLRSNIIAVLRRQ
jgi:ubiquinone/menaquinone biosynthesis C-methylase UbiE